MNKSLIGKRLAQLRDELAIPGEENWTQGRVASETGLTLNQVARLEQTAAGSVDGFVTLLLFYLEKGYNLTWILLDDNSHVSKMAVVEDAKTIDVTQALLKIETMRQGVSREIDMLASALAE